VFLFAIFYYLVSAMYVSFSLFGVGARLGKKYSVCKLGEMKAQPGDMETHLQALETWRLTFRPWRHGDSPSGPGDLETHLQALETWRLTFRPWRHGDSPSGPGDLETHLQTMET
jgi:hypothetical protein